jgi:hypothetical protein
MQTAGCITLSGFFASWAFAAFAEALRLRSQLLAFACLPRERRRIIRRGCGVLCTALHNDRRLFRRDRLALAAGGIGGCTTALLVLP